MIVRLDLERRAPAVAEIDDACVFARRHDHSWSSCRQTFQMNARRFVRAVLGPHDREDSEFCKTRFTTKQFLYSLEFCLSEVMGGDNFGRNHRKFELSAVLCVSRRSLRQKILLTQRSQRCAENRRVTNCYLS